LKPLVVPEIKGERKPPGGTPRARIRKALESGHTVLVLSDGPPSIPPHLSRYRLDALQAAVATGRPLVPVAIRGTGRILQIGSHLVHRSEARIAVGAPIHAEPDGGRELVSLRDALREAIAELCR
jgi:1-acyl-sn-glycerol-3-phosphate acyltransferase